MAFLVTQNGLVARVRTETTGDVRFASQRSREALNAKREWNLVNATSGKIVDTKKWHDAYERMEYLPLAVEINPGEFYIEPEESDD